MINSMDRKWNSTIIYNNINNKFFYINYFKI